MLWSTVQYSTVGGNKRKVEKCGVCTRWSSARCDHDGKCTNTVLKLEEFEAHTVCLLRESGYNFGLLYVDIHDCFLEGNTVRDDRSYGKGENGIKYIP